MTPRSDMLIATLDLGACFNRQDLVTKLQSCRAFNLETLYRLHSRPSWMSPDAYDALVRAKRREVAMCEEALTGFGEPLDVPEADRE